MARADRSTAAGRDPADVPAAPVRRLSWAAGLVAAAFVVSVIPGVRRHPGYSPLLDGGLETASWTLSAVLCLVRALRSPARAGWILIGLGLLAESAGQGVEFWFIQWERPVPYPSAADALLLAFYPLTYVGIALVLRQRRGSMPASAWLDGLIAGLSVAAIAAGTVLSSVLALSGGRLSEVVINLAYPVGDVTLLAVLGAALVVGLGRSRSMALLTGSILASVVADTSYLWKASAGTYHAGSWIDALWTVVLLLSGLAPPATRRRPAGPVQGAGRSSAARGWPVVGVLVVLVLGDVVLLDLHPDEAGGAAATVLASAAVVAALARLVITLFEVRQLAETRREARTDELTGLMNRRGFYREVTARLEAAPEGERALLLLDLDRFKEVNDSLGHHAGDQLLALVGPRLQSVLAVEDLLGRLGGDEFGVLLAAADEARAVAVARELRQALSSPFPFESIGLQTDASIGISLAPRHGQTISRLLRSADIAMYQAKNAHSGQRVFDVAGDIERELRLRTVAELRTALRHGQLLLHYQPKADPRTGGITGVEALVRWDHPTRGLLYPGGFLDPVEGAGLMPEMTRVVLEMALDQAAAWAAAGRPLKVAVNLSASSLVDTHLAAQVRGLLAARDLAATALQLEITEDFLLADRDRARLVLSQLRDDGVTIAVDDFGTGYSSLAYLRELPIDELKLDQSFVFPMADDARAAALVRSVVWLAHSLGLRLVAEGVENATAYRELARYGCDEIQGYFLSRPLPAAELEWWLDHRVPEPELPELPLRS